jgi:hypothetical protein
MPYPMTIPQYSMPIMMARGGLASAAQSVQSQGRGRDTMLVHMTPKEVGGLQALARSQGGSLTINPQTGLPEAGLLENMLPTILGIGGTFFGIPPHITAMAVGGLQTARTGDLGKGLLAGLGAYGGASLGSGVMSAGTAAEASNLASAGTADALTAAGTNALEASAPALTPTQQFTTGAQNLFSSGQSGDAARTAFMGKVGGASGLASDVGMAASPALFEQPDYSVPPPKVEESNYAGPYTPSDRGVRFPNEEERRRSTSEFSFFENTNPVPFAEGGSVGGRTVGMPQPDMYGDMLSRMNESISGPFDTVQGMAQGGLTALKAGGLREGAFIIPADVISHLGNGSSEAGMKIVRERLNARPIKGPGDGMSDSIPTTIAGRQKARVANEEAEVPPEMVASLGGGSMEKGAKKLFEMMDEVRQARTGKKKQSPEIRAERHVPN